MKNKFLAVISSLVLLISTVSAGLISASAEVDYTVLYNSDTKKQVTQEVVTALGTNLLSGCVPVCDPDTVTWATNDNNYKSIADFATLLTDGTIHYDKASQLIQSAITNVMPCIWFDMGQVYDVSDIVVGSMRSKSFDFGLASYEIYISDFSDGLFDPANMVATYTNDPQTFQDAIAADDTNRGFKNDTHSATIIKFNKGSEKTGRYFGIKILKACNYAEYQNNKIVRLSELGVYGTVSSHVPKNYQILNNTKDGRNVSQDKFNALGTSIILGKTAVTNITVSDANNQLLTDGNIVSKYGDKTVDILVGSSTIPTFTYDLGMVYNINKLAICGTCMQSYDIAFAQYEIYIGDSADTLYSSANKAAEYDSGTIFADAKAADQSIYTNMIGAGQFFIFNETPQGRYLGIKALKTNNYDRYLRLSEFAAFGEPVENKETQEAPDAPALSIRSSEFVTLTAAEGYEYSMDGSNWKTVPTFRRLKTGVDYTFYQRKAETETAYASDSSAALQVQLYKEGDTGHDGSVDSADLSSVQKHLINAETCADLFAADANLDGSVDIRDLVRIKRITQGDKFYTAKYIALTFDDGPNGDDTTNVLDVLENNGAKATFFLIGSHITSNQYEIMQRAVNLGCEFGNHSNDGNSMNEMAADEISERISAVNTAVINAVGEQYAPKYFRAPNLAVSDTMEATITDLTWINGYGLSSAGLTEGTASADEVSAAIVSLAKDGAIIRMHDASYGANTEGIASAITQLKAMGYQFVTVSELIELSGITPAVGTTYSDIY